MYGQEPLIVLLLELYNTITATIMVRLLNNTEYVIRVVSICYERIQDFGLSRMLLRAPEDL